MYNIIMNQSFDLNVSSMNITVFLRGLFSSDHYATSRLQLYFVTTPFLFFGVVFALRP
jgi:hypothetical protein